MLTIIDKAQLARQGLVHTGNVELLDRFAKSITLLHIHGMLTDSECTKARTRLIKQLKVSPK